MAEVIRFRDDEAPMEPAVSLEAFLEQSNSSAVLIEPGEDVRELLPHLDRVQLVEIDFPAFTDGRGYSTAQILRENGYAGEIRARGDVLIDQVRHMHRAGFDSLHPDTPLDRDAVEAAFARFPQVYQRTSDSQPAIWNLRHGK